MNITYIDRQTREVCREAIYCEKWLRFFYSPFGSPLGHCLAKLPFVSAWIGHLQRRPASKKKIAPFVTQYSIDLSEAKKKVGEFISFDDFFVRTLKPEARPLSPAALITPADGRYWVYPDLSRAEGLYIKGEKFSLSHFLQDETLAKTYEKGGLVFARLCPTDYHRFHFPCDCLPEEGRLINGPLYSVNPLALRKNIHILTSNKRRITPLHSTRFGTLLFCEIGATNVGSIHQTYSPNIPVEKGVEKGFFSFGASALLLLFEPGAVTFCDDLIDSSLEIRCLMGQALCQ